MKNFKIYLVTFIFVFNLSFFLPGNNFISNEYNNKDNKNVLPPLATSNSLSSIWYRTWGGVSSDGGYGIAVDSSDNIYVTGYTSSFGAGEDDIILLKYDKDGLLQWYRRWGGGSWDIGYGVAVDSLDNVYVVGETSSFGAALKDIVLLKYNGSGTLLWNCTWGGVNWEFCKGMAIDSLNNVYLGGYIDYGGGRNIILVKYDQSGIFQWNCTWDENNQDTCFGVAVDSSDYVYVSGTTTNIESWDIVLVKYNGNGIQEWNQTWGRDDFTDNNRGVIVDSSGYVYVTGITTSHTTSDPNMVLVKYDGNGWLQWNRTWGGSGSDMGEGLAVDSSNNIYIAGGTDSFGAGDFDTVLVKYDANGAQKWNRTWGGVSTDGAYGVAVNSLDNVYVVGETSSFGAGESDMVLVKYGIKTASTAIQSYNFFILIGILSISSYFLIKTILKKKSN